MDRQPNFLLIITDQHRADHLGCYGNPIVRTPSIDRLAQVLATTNGSVWGTVETVLTAMGRDADRGDDDVAIVVAQHRR